MDNVLQFGSVIVNSNYSKKVQINNLGDTSVKYNWNISPDKKKIITIKPETVVLLPQTDF